MVSSDFGKLDVQRHFSSGIDWAMAGMATLVAAVATPVSPAALRNSRRFMVSSRRKPLVRAVRDPAPSTFGYHERRIGGNLLGNPRVRHFRLRDRAVQHPVFVQPPLPPPEPFPPTPVLPSPIRPPLHAPL